MAHPQDTSERIVRFGTETLTLKFPLPKESCFLPPRKIMSLQYLAALEIIKSIEPKMATISFKIDKEDMEYLIFQVFNNRKGTNSKIIELYLPNKMKYALIELRNSLDTKIVFSQISYFLDEFLFLKVDRLAAVVPSCMIHSNYIVIQYMRNARFLGAKVMFMCHPRLKSDHLMLNWKVDLQIAWCLYPFDSEMEYKCYIYNNLHQHCLVGL